EGVRRGRGRRGSCPGALLPGKSALGRPSSFDTRSGRPLDGRGASARGGPGQIHRRLRRGFRLMRPLFIAGNWKSNPVTSKEAVELAVAVKSGVGQSTDVRVAVCAPSVFLHELDKVLEGSLIGLGAQNMHWKSAGAYTGELAGAMLNDAGCTH